MSELAREITFEDDIEKSLINNGGYTKGDAKAFDRENALDKATFIDFIKSSQTKEWKKFTAIYKDKSEEQIISRFCESVKKQGMLSILRKGFIDRGISFRPLFWKPETLLNQQTIKQYEANIFHCTRQLKYSKDNENSVDIVLFINGIPLVSMELKCQFTGQSTDNAIAQYKFTRSNKEPIFQFNKRVLAHFAVDLSSVYMTTKLAGANTYFLPFNQGSNGAGNVGGAGNPTNTENYETAYLWEEVLAKDSLLEILQKYMHLHVKNKKDKNGKERTSENLIFPRYHQLDVVTKLLADVKTLGSGKNYLIQHSAGSGKSNSIAWLSHRLASLHNANNEEIFHSVIVVTDRRVLDSQLQDTIYQFDHVEGVVKKISKSTELKEAINDNVKIIITTLQKFPVIYKEIKSNNKRFAIIIDEAHSSQTGNASHKLKYALADIEKVLEEHAQTEYNTEKEIKDDEDKLLKELATHGKQDNLSFFAFTATPKDKTLQAFGMQLADNKYYPFHVYSMKQAIEEGFIHDVLKNYMTYNMYYKIVKKIKDDPELETSAGLKAIRKYESLHPHNIAQKTNVILEHFQNVTKHKINGKAKAILVTPSRLHAVKYCEELKKQIADNKFDLSVLVAFSGEVYDKDLDKTFTEESLNKNADGQTIKEKELPSYFETDEFGMLIVAEKYQTGFDQPLLHTMFVDKKLSGVKAVQTLSRLNRTAYGKADTFILDFVNSEEDIKKSFEPYYEETVLEKENDPNIIYDIKENLDKFRVYTQEDIDNFCKLFYSLEYEANNTGKLYATLKPALEKYDALSIDDKEVFKTALARFTRIYAFITQVCRMFDKEIHKYSVFARFLLKILPKDTSEKVNLDDKIMLEYYKLEKGFEGSITLEATQDGATGIKGETGKKEKKKDPLTILIDQINERFGTEFTEMDKVAMQMQQDWVKNKTNINYASSNDKATFMAYFMQEFPKIMASRYEENNQFFDIIANNADAQELFIRNMGELIYENTKNG